jgi:hypothetical protein
MMTRLNPDINGANGLISAGASGQVAGGGFIDIHNQTIELEKQLAEKKKVKE